MRAAEVFPAVHRPDAFVPRTQRGMQMLRC